MSKLKVGDRVQHKMYPEYKGYVAKVTGDWYEIEFDGIKGKIGYTGSYLELVPKPEYELDKWYEFDSKIDILNLYHPKNLKEVGVDYEFSRDKDANITHFRLFKREPWVETKTLWGEHIGSNDWDFSYFSVGYEPTHKITFNTVDGEPDVTSIRMEKL